MNSTCPRLASWNSSPRRTRLSSVAGCSHLGLALAGIHDAEGLIWFTALISAVHLARRFLDSNRVHKIMDRITGTVLIGFGLELALSSR